MTYMYLIFSKPTILIHTFRKNYLRQLVEPPEQLVEGGNQLRGGELLRQRREVDDVGVQYAEIRIDLILSRISTYLIDSTYET